MPRFSANISMMFTERDLLDRPKAAADAGFGAIEVQFPYDEKPEAWQKAVEAADVAVAVFNIPVGDMLTGGPGIAAMPGREAEFAEACEQAKPYVEALNPVNVNVLTGWPPESEDRSICWSTLANNLAHAGDFFRRTGTRVLVEAVNGRDRPGYFLQQSRDAVRAIRVAARRNLGIEYDIYHMQIMEGDLVPTMTEILPHVGHIQFADTPGRHEPGTGEINFPFVFKALDEMGYEGWVGAEYNPTKQTERTLTWLKPWKGNR